MYYFFTTVWVIFLTVLTLPSHGQPKNNKVFLSGTVKNFDNSVQVEDKSEMEDLSIPSSERTFLADSSGHFQIEFALDKPNYFRIGRNQLYLSPGDSISIFVDYEWPDSATFKGIHSEENEYLKSTPFPKAGSFLDAGDLIKSTLMETADEIIKAANQRMDVLNAHINFSPEFKELETIRIQSDLLNSFNKLPWYFNYVHKVKPDSVQLIQAEFATNIQPLIKKLKSVPLGRKYLKIEVYRDILPDLLMDTIKGANDIAPIKAYLNAQRLIHAMVSSNDKNNISAFKEKLEGITDLEYRERVDNTLKRLIQFNQTIAHNIVMKDIQGQIVHLESLKGKIIYIDVWATWCGPCITEMPYLDSLRLRYKNNKDVAVVSLSIDGDRIRWIDFLRKHNYRKNQFVIDMSELEPYYVTEIPRTILIDKRFTLAAIRAPSPSDKQLIPLIEKLLGH